MSAISIDSSVSDQYYLGDEVLSSRHQNCWEPTECKRAPSQALVRCTKQCFTYGNLRVAIPSHEDPSDSLSCPGTPPPCTSKQLFSQRRLPAPALTKLATLPVAAVEDDEPDAEKAHQLSGCPTARRLWAFGQDNNIDVSNWLDQQISVRAIARSAISSTSSSLMCDLPADIQAGGAFAGNSADQVDDLPPPAFELMGLL